MVPTQRAGGDVRLRPFFISRKTENGYFFSVEKSGRGMSFVWTGTWLS